MDGKQYCSRGNVYSVGWCFIRVDYLYSNCNQGNWVLYLLSEDIGSNDFIRSE